MNLKQISEFPDYAISDDGRVFRLTNKRQHVNRIYDQPRELRGRKVGKNGKYLSICLCLNGTKEYRLIHRLVLITHGCLPPTDKHQVAHIDGDSTNNRIDNLMWVTQSENESHKLLHGTAVNGIRNGQAKLTTEQVSEIRNLASEGFMLKDIAKQFGVGASNIGMIVSFRTRRVA